MVSIGEEQNLLATTFRRDGTPVGTPVWPIPRGENRIAFITGELTGKAKRLRTNPRITLQPCDLHGNVLDGSSAAEGAAEIVTGEDQEQIFALVIEKYGQEAWDAAMEMAKAYFAESGGYGEEIGVVVTLDA
jgi:PPOX class probable F420-dependent enzyme